MKKYFIFFALFFISQSIYGQKIIFTNPFGGQSSNGGISSFDIVTGQVTTPISLPGNPLGLVDGYKLYDRDGYYDGDTKFGDNHRKENGLFGASDGYVYGLDQFASTFYNNNVGSAVLYRFRPDNQQIEVLHNFNGSEQHISQTVVGAYKNALSRPRFGMIEGAPGVLYGICIKGGIYGKGGIWKYEIAKRKFTEVASFDPGSIGYDPSGPLFKAFNNQIYGVLSKKTGTPDFQDGHLYQVPINSDTIYYTTNLNRNFKGSFTNQYPNGPVAYDPINQTMYGARMYFQGGLDFSEGGGLYSYNFKTKAVTDLNEIFSRRAVLGSTLRGIVRGNDGDYYGITETEGQSGNGVLIKINDPKYGAADFIRVADFPESASGNSIIAVADKIFGTYLDYGDKNRGIWCYSISTGILTSLLPGSGPFGYGVLPQLGVIGNTIYARTIFGGKNNAGGIVAINALSLEIRPVLTAFETTGKSAVGELFDIGNNEFLGFSNTGGALADNYRNLSGNILRYNLTKKTVTAVTSLPTMTKTEFEEAASGAINGSSFENYPFTFKPYGMFRGTDGKIYFSILTASIPLYPFKYEQHRPYHRFCEFDPASNSIKEITKIIDADPHQSIEYLPGKFLFKGLDSLVVFDLATNSKKTVQRQPDPTIYGFLQGKWLKGSDGLIYGTTNKNLIFSGSQSLLYVLDPANNFNFSSLAILNNASQANIGLTEVNGKIYGSTASGGINNHGYIFSYDIKNKLFNEVYSFNADIDGANFSAGWTLNNGKLYSTSQAGGANGYGTLVEFSPASNSLKVLSDLTIQNGNGIFATPIFPAFPIIADSTDIITKDTTICSSNSIIIKAISNSVANPIFKWYSDSTLSKILFTGDNFSTPALTQTTNYYIAVSGAGVIQNPTLNGKKVTVTVNPNPITPIISADKLSICIGDSSNLTSSNLTGNQWFKNGLLIAGAIQNSIKVNESGNYTVKTTNSTNCSSPISAPISITVNVIPATPTISSTKLSFCSGDSSILSSSAATNNQWYRDGGLITAATNTTLKVTVTGNYTVRTTSAASCVSAISAAAVITTNAIPVAPIVSSDKQSFCAGDLATLTSNSLTGNQWYKDGLLISGATASTYKATVSGNYTATASSSSSCTSALSNGITILSNPIPTTPIVVADGDTKICKDDIRNLSIVLPANTTSQWYKNGSVITGATNATLAVSEAGIYTNRLSAGLCVSALSNAVTIEVPCVAAIMMPDVFTPNGDGYNDKLYAIIPGIKLLRTFEIYNRLGNLVFSTADPSKAWDGTYKGSNQPSESYIWIIEGVDGSGRKIKKTGVITLVR